MVLLEAERLVKEIGRRKIVRDFSLKIAPGEILGLLGPNGAGKSTAFHLMMGLIHSDEGVLRWKGEEITRWPMHRRARAGMGYLAQEPSLFRGLSLIDNLLAVLELQPLNHRERYQKAQELLEEMHLTPYQKQDAATLSGGQRRRLEIARALAINPQLLLLDEPFANVDPLTIQEVKAMIRFLGSRGIAVLITDHNAREIFSVVERAYVMMEGMILAEGTPLELIMHEETRRAYLGEDLAETLLESMSPSRG